MFRDLSRHVAFLPRQTPDSLDGLDERLRIYQDQTLEIWYAPLGAAPLAPRLWILGITPGWRQMRIAYQGAALALQSGKEPADAAMISKPQVAFAGSMRKNLVAMLDDLSLPDFLGVHSSAELFGSEHLRTGSALKYPVFRSGRNYTGHTPKPLRHAALRDMIDTVLIDELRAVEDCLILPLGNAVESILRYAIQKGSVDESRILFGFPHPSGANGHRVRRFKANQRALRAAVSNWFGAGGRP